MASCQTSLVWSLLLFQVTYIIRFKPIKVAGFPIYTKIFNLWMLWWWQKSSPSYLHITTNVSINVIKWPWWSAFLNTLRSRQDGRCFPDDSFKCIFLNENAWISIKISLKFVRKSFPALVQIIAWCRPGDKPLSESMMLSLLTHIFLTRPQWVKSL